MIEVTRLNGTRFWLNSSLIEQIESAPDTVITLTTGNNFIVRENVTDVVKMIRSYHGHVRKESTKKLASVTSKGAR